MRSNYRAVLAETEKKHIIPVRISGTVVEIQTKCFSNSGEAHYSYAHLFVSLQHEDIILLTPIATVYREGARHGEVET
jgi:hypothetical protein